jgi:hypothetical protein
LFFGVEEHAAYTSTAVNRAAKTPADMIPELSDDAWSMAQQKYSFTSRPHATWWLYQLANSGGDDVRMRREFPVVDAHAWSAAQGRWVSVDPPVLPYLKEGKVKYFTQPNGDNYYIIGVDPAGGSGGDQAVIIVYDMTKRKIAAMLADNQTTLDSLVNIAGMLQAKYRAQMIYIEKNGIGAGATVLGRLAGLPVEEFNTSESTKYTGMLLARKWIEGGGGADESLLSNAQSCRMDLVGQKEKFSGGKDCLMALGFCLRFAPAYDVIINTPKPKVYAENEFNGAKILANAAKNNRR